MTRHRNRQHRWAALFLIALAQIGAMSTWFSAAAVAPTLARDWHLGPAQVALLTVAVQIGFVGGALIVAMSGLADILSSRTVFVASALLASAANALLVSVPGKLAAATALRLALGVCLVGVYPTGMKMMAGWFREDRGLAIGTLVGALTLGSAAPHFVAGRGGTLPWQTVIAVTSLGAVVSAALVGLFVRPGPFEIPASRIDWGWAFRSFRDPALRLAYGGYFGHMWELYAMWTWLPAFLAASFQLTDAAPDARAVARLASLASGLVIAAGAVGCIVAGLLADRLGRTLITAVAMMLSGACAVATGALFGQAPALVVGVAFVWGLSIVADSAQFSTAISELTDPQRTGSALAVQTAAGFLLTAVSIQALPIIQRWSGWPGALVVLAGGPAIGAAAMLQLRRRPEAVKLAGGRR